MNILRPVLIAALALAGCATTSVPPDGAGSIARLSPEELARMTPAPLSGLSLADIVRMSKEGVAAKDIIVRIRQTNSHYDLAASQAIDLHAQGVEKEVLDYIQSARAQELRDRVAEEINQRDRLHAEQLRREQELRLNNTYYDPWRSGYPGFGWGPGYPFRPNGGFYWRR
jgi:hypothetical protein